MKIFEIILPNSIKDKSISSNTLRKAEFLKNKIDRYVDVIKDPKTKADDRSFYQRQLSDTLSELKNAINEMKIQTSQKLGEAVHKIPITDKDFEFVKEMLEKPIPAILAPIIINEIVIDDELNDQLSSVENTNPTMDVRTLLVDWIKRVMPDQIPRLTGDEISMQQKLGKISPIHGYDPGQYTSAGVGSSGNAYGRR